MKNINKYRLVLFASAIFAVLFALGVSVANAQTATFFATKDNATEYKVFRYQVSPTTSPVLETTITDSSLIYPLGLTLSPAGELFVVNQGTAGGFVSRFLNPTGTSVFNGTVSAGPEPTFYGAFRGNELFVCQRSSGVLRFIVDPITGVVTPNGQIPITATIGEFRGVVVTPWGELFVSEISGNAAIIHRVTFNTNGNAQPNGTISNPNMGLTHGMVFSPWGELFATSPSNNSIARFTFDSSRNASYNGSITGGGLAYPLDVSFAPWGELFVGNCLCRDAPFSPGAYQGISRFNFNNAYVASSNGVVTTPLPISGITFVPAPIAPTTNIDPQAYTGNYILYNRDTNTNLGTFSGTQSLNLVAGNYQFDNSNQVGASAFNFSVNQFGQVSSVSNPNAAQAIGNTLRLNNTTINIEPGGYTGRYKFLASNSFYTGSQSFVVVPGLRYGVDNGTGRGGAAAQSYFYFDVGANGAISNIDVPVAATASGNTLNFNNQTLIIEPNGYTGNYNLSSHYTIAPYISGRQSFVMIPGLLYAFDAGTGSYEPTFKLDANGSPTNISPSGFAAGINNILVLANVSVRVDPTNYGGNYRLNDRIFSGIQNLVLIPQMRFYVAVNNSVEYFTPTPTQVTPPSVSLNNNAQTFNFSIAPQDSTAPATIAAPNPNANAAGWNNSNVNVSLSATDNSGGTGVSQITYSASGAQPISQTTVNGASANLAITAEGETVISYYARDNAGNTEAAQTLVVKIDKTAPSINSSATAGGNPYTAGTWTNLNVVVSFDCIDALSGTANVTQPVTLSNEGANQSANGTCSDVAGNNANTSFANIKIDKTAPTISITAPTSGNYLLNQAVSVSFSCTDSLSGVATCTGTTANGGQLNTASIGAKTFTVSSTDNVGNSASPTTVNYTVNFGLVILFDQTRAHKSGSTVPIKIRLVDANGTNVSSAATVVRAVSVIQTGSQASTILEDAGNSNPDFDFRYDQSLGGYIFNLKTTGYGTGTYRLNFIAGNSPTIYSVQFQVRQ